MNVGVVVTTTELINMYAADVVGGREEVVVTARRQLATLPAPGTNTVLVSHGNVLQGAAGIQLAEGEAAVFAPGSEGNFTLIARVLPGEWAALAEQNKPLAAASTLTPSTPVEVCEPTPPDQLGPFYVPNAPERASVGQGHILSGVVRSSADCAPIARARIEIWLVNPNGEYDDEHRATLFSDASGAYRFESNVPPPYASRPPHIHVRVSAQGYHELVTQYYPAPGQTEGAFDLVLIPESQVHGAGFPAPHPVPLRI